MVRFPHLTLESPTDCLSLLPLNGSSRTKRSACLACLRGDSDASANMFHIYTHTHKHNPSLTYCHKQSHRHIFGPCGNACLSFGSAPDWRYRVLDADRCQGSFCKTSPSPDKKLKPPAFCLSLHSQLPKPPAGIWLLAVRMLPLREN